MSSSSRRSGIDLQKQLEVIKSLIVTGAYHYSKKIRQFIDDGWYETDDLERCILSATSIHKVEEDDMGAAVDSCKYTIIGRDTQRQPFYTCGKIILSQSHQRLYFFITAHEAT